MGAAGCGGRAGSTANSNGGQEAGSRQSDIDAFAFSEEGGESAPPAACVTDNDCSQPAEQFCDPCFDGGEVCASFHCVSGTCVGTAANCGGPLSNPCAGIACGGACTQCDTLDGGCYSGTCNWFNECKSAANPVCSITATRSCTPTDGAGIGDCDIPLGWAWDGSKCIAVVGCICRGGDCGTLLPDSQTCDDVFGQCAED